MRPGEIFLLTRRDVVFSSSLDPYDLRQHSAVLTLQLPKTRKRGARRQHVLITDGLLVTWLHLECSRLLMDQCLLPYSSATARRRLGQLLEALGIPVGVYTWASLRPGGASFEYMAGTPVETLRFRGRWAVPRSLEHYVQECLTYLDVVGMSSKTWARVVHVSTSCYGLVSEHVGQLSAPRHGQH
jgi:hypothetical protein